MGKKRSRSAHWGKGRELLILLQLPITVKTAVNVAKRRMTMRIMTEVMKKMLAWVKLREHFSLSKEYEWEASSADKCR